MPKTATLCVLFAFLSGAAFGQRIVVTSPGGVDTWRVGEMHAITWTRSGVMYEMRRPARAPTPVFRNPLSMLFEGVDRVRSAGRLAPWRVIQQLRVTLRNCGYNSIRNGELRVSQHGVISGDEPGMAPSLRTRELLRTPVDVVPALGSERFFQTESIRFCTQPSEIVVEYIWEDEGLHTEAAVYRFNIDFRYLFDMPLP